MAIARRRMNVSFSPHGSTSMRAALVEDFRPGDSDVDLLVQFKALSPHELVDVYFDLLDELRSILGVEVDLVMVEAVKNRYIAADIARTKQVLYAA